jgi:hypothetical protein
MRRSRSDRDEAWTETVAPVEPDGSVGAAFSASSGNIRRWMAKMMKVPRVALAPARAWLGLWLFAGLLAGGSAPAQAQQLSTEFSADMVMTGDDAAVPVGRLRVFDGKVRIETPEFANAFFLVDVSKPSAYFVRPAMHIYMDARQSSRLTRWFVPVDPSDPCRQWQAMAQLAGVAGEHDWRCEQVGEETIDGRNTIVFRASFDLGQEHSGGLLGWIDRLRRFPLRIKTEDGATVALEHVSDEAQPAAAFALPPGLRKFSPEALVEQIKQSDVWVGQPNDGGSSRRDQPTAFVTDR